MPGVTPSAIASRLHQVQSFKEVAWGTPGQASARWMGVAPSPQFTPFIKSTVYDENRGSLQASFLSDVLQLGGEYNINWNYASYEDINFALQNALQAVSPSGGGPYTYTYLAPTTSVNALQPFTLEYGYDILAGQYAGCIGNKLSIKGEMKKPWEVGLSGFFKSYTPNVAHNIVSSTNATPIVITDTAHGYTTGDQVIITGHLVNTAANGTWTIINTGANTYSLTGSVGNGVGAATGTVAKTLTPAISDRSVSAIIFPGTTLAIEGANGTPGTTPFTGSLLSFALNFENSAQPIFGGDSKAPINYTWDKSKLDLTLRLLYNAQVKALVDTTLLGGGRIVTQLKQVSGTKSAEIDFAGVLAEDPKRWGNELGASSIELKLTGQYDSGALANSLKAIIINSVSALP